MTVLTLASLLVQKTKAEIYERALSIAESIGVPVTTWQPGDPTRSLYYIEAEQLAEMEPTISGFISSGFIGLASGVWKKVCAKQQYNVDVHEATYATTDVVLTNADAFATYEIDPGDLTFKSGLTEKTYHSTTGGALAPGGTLTVSVVADEAGADSSAAAGEIDELVTTLLGVTCTNPTAAIGRDEQDEATTELQCLDKLDSFSPNGASGAYTYVARNPDLTGTTAVTRARDLSDSDTGDVTIYIAGPSGAVPEPDRLLVEAAIARTCMPLCITVSVLSATPVVVPVTYEMWVYKSVNRTDAQIQTEVQTALEKMVSAHPIGGDIIDPDAPGYLFASLVESTIRSVYKDSAASRDPVFRVSMSVPAADTPFDRSQVVSLGVVTGIIHFVQDP